MLKIGLALGVDGYLSLDAAKMLMREGGLEPEIDLIGLRDMEKSYDILILSRFKENIDFGLYISLMSPRGILLLNSDEREFKRLAIKKPVELVTYGFNPKSSITASSVVESEFTTVACCVQRSLADINGAEICPQEFTVNIYEPNLSVTDALCVVSAGVLAGLGINRAVSGFNILPKAVSRL